MMAQRCNGSQRYNADSSRQLCNADTPRLVRPLHRCANAAAWSVRCKAATLLQPPRDIASVKHNTTPRLASRNITHHPPCNAPHGSHSTHVAPFRQWYNAETHNTNQANTSLCNDTADTQPSHDIHICGCIWAFDRWASNLYHVSNV